jgi:asparaginyl-tRNA synthetase
VVLFNLNICLLLLKMTIKNINDNYLKYIDKELEINGYVQTIRNQKDVTFIKINDGSTSSSIQLVVDNEKSFKISTENIHTGTSINVKGTLIKSPAQGQNFEIQVSELNILGLCNPDEYPLAKGKLSLVYLRSYYHLRFRTNTFGSIFRIKSCIDFATHLFFHNKEYLHLDPNILTTGECEGGAGVFQVTENDITNLDKLPFIENPVLNETVPINNTILNLTNTNQKKYDWSKDHFNTPVYLTVSSQLQLEAISSAMGAVYTTNKSFRSEHSNTNKHLSEFTHLEIENTFINLDNLMDISEEYIKFIGNYLLKNSLDDLKNLDNFISKGIIEKITKLINDDFIRLEYKDAIELIQKNSKIKIVFGEDLSSEAENFLCEYYNNVGVFVKNWDRSIKSFYMKQNDDNITCANFDLIMPYKVGELIGGSMREENLDKLLNMMKIKNISVEPLQFYLDLRRFGSVPHGGWGLGMDRLCMLFTGIENIRDVIPFPVSYQNCKY